MAISINLTATCLDVDPTCRVLKKADYSLHADAEKIIIAAQEEAAQIIEQAKIEFEKEKARGYEEGLLAIKADQVEHTIKMVGQAIDYLSNIEDTLANILMSGVKKIVGEFDKTELTVNLIRNALQHVRNEKHVTVRIAPDQCAEVQERLNSILADYRGVGFIDLVSDPRLSHGDCIMESPMGVVDASVEVQLAAMQRRFDAIKSMITQSAADLEYDD